MIRPFTCVCLVLAAGSGLYLYQVKQRAFALDASLRSTFHDIDMAREKTRMLRADWALMNDPERLQTLSDQYLTLKPMGPSQLMTLDQLAATLPPPLPPGSKPVVPDMAVPATDPTHGVPMASNAAPVPSGDASGGTAVAMLQPSLSAPVAAPNAGTDAGASDGAAPTAAKDSAPASVASAASAVIAPKVAASLAPHAVSPSLPKVAAVVPHVTHHAEKRVQPAVVKSVIPQVSTGASLADASAVALPKPPHHNTHHAKPAAPNSGTQYFAANEPAHPAYGGDRITPPAATVMYTPVGSSLGMASAASLAPPRPLYSSSQ